MKKKSTIAQNAGDLVPDYARPEEEQGYYKSVTDLLDHYEDGWNLFIKAHRDKNYDYPLPVKEEHKNNPYIPQSWLALTDKVIQIIATEKYGLDCYENEIQIIRSDQMLDAYTTIGLPTSYNHWGFGKRRMKEEKDFDQNHHLAYEIVINSDRCLAYCMDTNTPLLQMIVIAHASYGHNTTFKNNYMLAQVDATTILAEAQHIKDYIRECEDVYGEKEVSDFLDFCHAMRYMDISPNPKPAVKSKKDLAAMQEKSKLAHIFGEESDGNRTANDNGAAKKQPYHHPSEGQRNIMAFMADNAPHLPRWKRDIMRHMSRIAQYFRPQMYDSVLNEGMATYTHDRILTTMRDIGLMDLGMYAEYKQLNAGATYQPSAVRYVRDEEGKIQQQFVGADINIYTLGFKILEEIERICREPTDEDKKWFHFAGEPDWIQVIKDAVFNNSDETFIHQYLSPKAVRDLKLFTLGSVDEKDLDQETKWMAKQRNVDIAMVSDVENDAGFRNIRRQLSSDRRISDKIPKMSLYDYQDKSDRCLILHHHVHEGQLLEPQDTRLVLELMHRTWGHPVVIESVDIDGKVLETHSSPPKYNYKVHRHHDNDMGGPAAG